jgi:transcriptional regulator with XRE-family HTH domain
MTQDWMKENAQDSLSTISRWIIEERDKSNLDQRGLADLTGTTQTSIRRLESGETNVSAVLLVRVAKALNMDLKKLLEPIKSERELVQIVSKANEAEIRKNTSAMGLTEEDMNNFYTQRDLLRLMKLWPR